MTSDSAQEEKQIHCPFCNSADKTKHLDGCPEWYDDPIKHSAMREYYDGWIDGYLGVEVEYLGLSLRNQVFALGYKNGEAVAQLLRRYKNG